MTRRLFGTGAHVSTVPGSGAGWQPEGEPASGRRFPAWAALLVGVLAVLLLCGCLTGGLWVSGVLPRLGEQITGSGPAESVTMAPLDGAPTVTSVFPPTWTPQPFSTPIAGDVGPATVTPVQSTSLPITPPSAATLPPPTVPDLTITTMSIEPAAPVSGEPFAVTVTIANIGDGAAAAFLVAVQGSGGEVAPAQLIPGLPAGGSQDVLFTLTSETAGPLTVTAVVDGDVSVVELNETNNSATFQASLMPASNRRLIVVTFDDVYIFTDADFWTDGDLYLEFQVNDEYVRWPGAGTIKVVNEERYLVGLTMTFLLDVADALTIWVNGTDDNTGLLFGTEDEMGTVYQEYTVMNQWGAGQSEHLSTCPAGCFSIRYTIQVIEPIVIEITDEGYSAPSLEAPAGSTLVWLNMGTTAHSATSTDGRFNTGEIAPGAFAAVTLTEPGTYPYYCAPHAGTDAAKSGTLTIR